MVYSVYVEGGQMLFSRDITLMDLLFLLRMSSKAFKGAFYASQSIFQCYLLVNEIVHGY